MAEPTTVIRPDAEKKPSLSVQEMAAEIRSRYPECEVLIDDQDAERISGFLKAVVNETGMPKSYLAEAKQRGMDTEATTKMAEVAYEDRKPFARRGSKLFQEDGSRVVMLAPSRAEMLHQLSAWDQEKLTRLNETDPEGVSDEAQQLQQRIRQAELAAAIEEVRDKFLSGRAGEGYAQFIDNAHRIKTETRFERVVAVMAAMHKKVMEEIQGAGKSE